MKRTAVLTLLTMLIGVPSILVADEPEQGQVATAAFDVTSVQLNIPSVPPPHVSVAASDISLSAFVAGVELLLARDKELTRELVAAVDHNNRPHQTRGIQHTRPRMLVTLDSNMSVTDFEQVIRFAIADNARLARALIIAQPGNQ